MTSLSQNFLNPNNKPLTIGEFTIHQDEEGRYCLNDLNRASGGEDKHKPKYWVNLVQTKDLVNEICKGEIPPLEQDHLIRTVHGGNNRGTYVSKDLVYSYAMWISAKFHLMVIRAYDSLVMEWILNEKQTISPDQAGILYNIVHTRAAGNKNLIVQMWSRLKNHFKYSASYRELKAFHFEDAKHYLEVMDLNAKPEKHEDNATLEKLQSFLDNLAHRYPSLQNPVAHEIAVRFAELLQYQDLTDERLFYYVAINKGKIVVLPQTVHHGVIDLVKLANAFEPLHEFMMGYEICSQARALKKLPLKPIPR